LGFLALRELGHSPGTRRRIVALHRELDF
jgi:hypothetical protein